LPARIIFFNTLVKQRWNSEEGGIKGSVMKLPYMSEVEVTERLSIENRS
jgi:hypothetical protein